MTKTLLAKRANTLALRNRLTAELKAINEQLRNYHQLLSTRRSAIVDAKVAFAEAKGYKKPSEELEAAAIACFRPHDDYFRDRRFGYLSAEDEAYNEGLRKPWEEAKAKLQAILDRDYQGKDYESLWHEWTDVLEAANADPAVRDAYAAFYRAEGDGASLGKEANDTRYKLIVAQDDLNELNMIYWLSKDELEVCRSFWREARQKYSPCMGWLYFNDDNELMEKDEPQGQSFINAPVLASYGSFEMAHGGGGAWTGYTFKKFLREIHDDFVTMCGENGRKLEA
jgi:hypothetical protein